MSVKIENLAGRLVSMRLNSGNMLHLAPGIISQELTDAEVINNAKILQLENLHYIVLHKIENKDS